MKCKVINIEEKQPHVCLPTHDGNIHVFPLSVIHDVVCGKLAIDDVDDYEKIVRTIFGEWEDIKLQEFKEVKK